ncbi:deoxycytidylate deaminase [Aquipluma nitroreducens]|uniref:Deoxycytidylate deaminase n=2 Tax=Aquipluma nitroreducens TaxID=2010828 RepID=A0A5K7SAD8_9BACT|nr:deoxycytidylate deaminase [Aquipluma nitroreducens]
MDLSYIYRLRNNFTIIGLTGRTSSGCSQIANQLVKGFDNGMNFEDPYEIGLNENKSGFKHNTFRKYRIIYDYAKCNFSGYSLIRYKDILTIFLLQSSFDEFIKFLNSSELKDKFQDSNLNIELEFSIEISKLEELRNSFNEFSILYKEIDVPRLKENNNWGKLFKFYYESGFISFSKKIHDILKENSLLKRNKVLQIISNNLRRSGNAFNFSDISADNIFTIVEFINDLVKSHRKQYENGRTQIVIDSLRNPFEIMFFKQRFSAFYVIAVNRDDQNREYNLRGKFTNDIWAETLKLIKEEYKGGEDCEFYKQNVSECIQQADIHITFLERSDAKKKNDIASKELEKNLFKTDNTSPYFSWQMQLLKYVSLISHPGLVSPSPEERCMQLAYTAKHNSGCISRHVGAAITDEFFSIKAIGWNNTPEGQVPCSLRNAEDLINLTTDLDAFTKYEKKREEELGKKGEFHAEFLEKFKTPIKDYKPNLKGRTVCFCFKDIKIHIPKAKIRFIHVLCMQRKVLFYKSQSMEELELKMGNYLRPQVLVSCVQKRHIN